MTMTSEVSIDSDSRMVFGDGTVINKTVPASAPRKVVEGAIRTYLNALASDVSFADAVQEQMAIHQTQADASTDPLEALKAIQASLDVKSKLLAAYRAECMKHLKVWCTDNSITNEALKQLGVTHDDLVAAGMAKKRGRKAKK